MKNKNEKIPSPGPTADGMQNETRAELKSGDSVFRQSNPETTENQSNPAKQNVEKTEPEEKTASPVVASTLSIVSMLIEATPDSLNERVIRVLSSVREYLALIYIISGACAHELTKDMHIGTGASYIDVDGEGRMATYRLIGGRLERSARTVEDDARIYRYCVAEPLETVLCGNRDKKLSELIRRLFQLPRGFFIEAVKVVDTENAIEIALQKRGELGRKNYTIKNFAADLEGFPRRQNVKEHSEGGSEDDGNAFGDDTPIGTGEEPRSIKRAIRLTERERICLVEISHEIDLTADETIGRALFYCRENLDVFAVSLEVYI